MEAFIDSSNKIIVSCPKCDNQDAIYLIRSNQLVDGLETVWCDSCNLPYVVRVKTELKCDIMTYGCNESKDAPFDNPVDDDTWEEICEKGGETL